MASVSFVLEAMIRGYHVYNDIWTAVVGEELHCEREPANASDPFAVAVIRSTASSSSETVGHEPRKISSICSIFLQ